MYDVASFRHNIMALLPTNSAIVLFSRIVLVLYGAAHAKRYTNNVRSRKVEKTAIKVMSCHKYAYKRVSQKSRNFVMPRYFLKRFSTLVSSLNPP